MGKLRLHFTGSTGGSFFGLNNDAMGAELPKTHVKPDNTPKSMADVVPEPPVPEPEPAVAGPAVAEPAAPLPEPEQPAAQPNQVLCLSAPRYIFVCRMFAVKS